MLGAVHDPSVFVNQDDVAVPPHNFRDNGLFADIAQLVSSLQLQADDPVKALLCDPKNSVPQQMLAHKHTEHGRCHRVFAGDLCQMHTRIGGAGREQETVWAVRCADGENDLIPFRLIDLVNFSAC